MKYHPDKNNDADAGEKFADVAGAWEILGDPDKRRVHDAYGSGQHFQHDPWAAHRQQQARQQQARVDLYAAAPLVTRLDGSSYAARARAASSPFAINFYADWCSHCVDMVPEWRRAALRLVDEDVEVGAVNCAAEGQLCGRMGINSFPNIRFLIPSLSPGAPSGAEGPLLLWTSFGSGQFTADALADWVTDTLAHVRRQRTAVLPPPSIPAEVLASDALWLVLFTAHSVDWCPACEAVEIALRRLSCEFEPPWDGSGGGGGGVPLARVAFAVVDCERPGGREQCLRRVGGGALRLRPRCAPSALGRLFGFGVPTQSQPIPPPNKRYGIGRPYGMHFGDMPQLLGFPPGLGKRNPEKILPAQAQFVNQLTAPIQARSFAAFRP